MNHVTEAVLAFWDDAFQISILNSNKKIKALCGPISELCYGQLLIRKSVIPKLDKYVFDFTRRENHLTLKAYM